MKSMFLTLAIFFLGACADKPATPDSGPTAPVVVDPAAPAPAVPGSDGGTAVVMPEAKVKIDTPPTPPAAPADVKPTPPHAP